MVIWMRGLDGKFRYSHLGSPREMAETAIETARHEPKPIEIMIGEKESTVTPNTDLNQLRLKIALDLKDLEREKAGKEFQEWADDVLERK